MRPHQKTETMKRDGESQSPFKSNAVLCDLFCATDKCYRYCWCRTSRKRVKIGHAYVLDCFILASTSIVGQEDDFVLYPVADLRHPEIPYHHGPFLHYYLKKHFYKQPNPFVTCTTSSGQSGTCTHKFACVLSGGRSGGSCYNGKVCCINVVTACERTVTLNNTYWQTPSTGVSRSSACSLTVRLEGKLKLQKKPICQVRLDFVSFTTAQPTDGTCMDTFDVYGSTTVTPTICGDNSGQHMYLDVPSSAVTPTNVQLLFDFGTETSERSWNIKIALLPCEASYLAPKNCLQYFTSDTGKVSSFNWQDVASTTTRQLNNQNYNICFRTELVPNKKANQLCLSVCSVTNGGDAFSITTPPAVLTAGGLASTGSYYAAIAATHSASGTLISDPQCTQPQTATCLYDFLLITSGRDPITGIEADRFCGNQLNPSPGSLVDSATVFIPGSTTSVKVCTSMEPFRITYRTDNTECSVDFNPPTIQAIADIANTGFCLEYEESYIH